MSNLVVNTLSGDGVKRSKEKGVGILEQTGKQYRGYDVKRVDASTLTCDSRNRPPVLGALAMSKFGPVEMVSSSEASQFQRETALRFDRGQITGSRMRFCPEGPNTVPWPDWTPVSKQGSESLVEQFRQADEGGKVTMQRVNGRKTELFTADMAHDVEDEFLK